MIERLPTGSAALAGQAVAEGGAAPAAPAARGRVRGRLVARRSSRYRPPARSSLGWPLIVLLGGFPIWWVTGLIAFVTMLCAVPMALELWRRRPLKVPAGFVWWALLLVWVLASSVMLRVQAPGTRPVSLDAGTLMGFGLRLGNYLSITVVLLYVGNLRPDELPLRRVVKLLAWVFAVTVAGGILGLLAPTLTFSSPLTYVMPHSLLSHGFVQRMMTVTTSQVQDIFGDTRSVRPSAPYEYTNTWGYAYNLLLPAFVAVCLVWRRRAMRWVGALVLLISVVPVVQSLNRGLWAGLALSFAWFLFNQARAGRIILVVSFASAAACLLLAVLVSPLGATVNARLANGHSDNTRTTLNSAAVQAAISSPLIGYGGNRETIGSGQSIAIGPTTACPLCGSRLIGSDGHLWLLLLQQGFVGAAYYVLFHLTVLWRYRRDITVVGMVGSTMVVLPLFYMIVYPALGPPMLFSMLGVAVLWRNSQRNQLRPLLEPRARPG